MKVSTNEQLTTYRILDATIGFADMASPFNWGADGAGHDVELFGVTSGHYLLWDTSEDDLILAGATATLSIDSTVDSSSAVTGSLHTDGGVGIAKALWVGTTSRLVGAVTMDAALGIAGLITSTSPTGFRSTAAFVPDATRTKYAFAVGQGHTDTNELAVTMVADGAQNFDPFQMNINIIGANPNATSTINLMYALLTHDTIDMAALRLKCTDFTVSVGENVLDAYVYQGEIDFTKAGITVGGEAVVAGFVLDAGANAVAADSFKGLSVTLRGAGAPAKAVCAMFASDAGCTVDAGLMIQGANMTSALRIGNQGYAALVTNFVAFPPAGSAPVSAHGGIANGGTVVKIACLVGTDTYYILASDTPA